MILGIDEVGRGPWAGPLVIGAVVLGGAMIEGLTDSKKLTKKRREELDEVIRDRAAAIGLGWVDAAEIDEKGLSWALREATKRAVEQINTPYHEIIIDGTINFLDGTTKGRYVTTMKRADLLVPSVSAASIIAKVARDNYMADQDKIYDGYGFASHVGYGTAVHRTAIEKSGVTPLHRLSFAPLKKYAPLRVELSQAPQVGDIASTTKTTGDRAENEAENYLLRNGHTILRRNWKTKYCEIDIVSQKENILYFAEVKYRKTDAQGGGIAAITKKKLNQMKFAAEYFVRVQNITDMDMLLAVITVEGTHFAIGEYLVLTD